MKLLMSQKMEELEYSRKSIKSLEKDLSDMQVNCDWKFVFVELSKTLAS